MGWVALSVCLLGNIIVRSHPFPTDESPAPMGARLLRDATVREFGRSLSRVIVMMEWRVLYASPIVRRGVGVGVIHLFD